MNELKKMLRALKQSRGLYTEFGFVYKYGQEFVPQELPKKYRRGRQKKCFKNAFNLVLAHILRRAPYHRSKGELVYVEGYAFHAVTGDLPVHHAWCIEQESNRVIDPTWKEPGLCYFGIPFKFSYVSQCIPALNDEEEGFALLHGKVPEREWLERLARPVSRKA